MRRKRPGVDVLADHREHGPRHGPDPRGARGAQDQLPRVLLGYRARRQLPVAVPAAGGADGARQSDVPDIRLDRYADDEAEAKERNAHRFAAWIAKFDTMYGLGGTKTEVEANLKQLRRFFADGKNVPGIGKPVTARGIGRMMLAESPAWAEVASQLSDFAKFAETDEPEGPPGGEPPAADPSPGPSVNPDFFSDSVNRAVWCNEEKGIREFEAWTKLNEQRRQRFPLAGGQAPIAPMCIGWPLPVQPWAVQQADAPLLVIGHAFESVTPGKWLRDMVGSIGGTPLIATDDVHASAFDGDCSDTVTSFLTGGEAPAPGARCDGLGEPKPERFPRPSAKAASRGRVSTYQPGLIGTYTPSRREPDRSKPGGDGPGPSARLGRLWILSSSSWSSRPSPACWH